MVKSSQIHTVFDEIKANRLFPIYFLLGEETYFKDKIINLLQTKLFNNPAEKKLNYIHIDGKDTSTTRIFETAYTLPAFATKKLIVVENFEKLKNLEDIIVYLESPARHSHIVLNSKERKLPDKLKILEKNPEVKIVICYTPFDNQMIMWVLDYMKSKNKKISPEAVHLLVDFCGNSLAEIEKELEKLLLYTYNKIEITTADVLALIPDVKKYDIFAIEDMLIRKDKKNLIKRINRIFSEKIYNAPGIVIISALKSFFQQVWFIKYLKTKLKKSDKEIMETMKVYSPMRFKKLLTAGERYKMTEIEKIIQELYKAEIFLKTTSISPQLAIERAILNFL